MPDKRKIAHDDIDDAPKAPEDVQLTSADQLENCNRFAVSPLPSASAPVIFFDAAPYFAHHPGYGGSLTLTTQRQTSDAAGVITEDRIITAMLKAPLPALLQLRDDINAIAEAEAKLAAAAQAALKKKPACSTAH